MATVPPCGFKCLGRKAFDYATEKKKPFLRLSIFYVLFVEIVSYFIRYEKNYACFWYPLLTQSVLFLLSFSLLLWRERLRFCLRKSLATAFLSGYYLFGMLALIFNCSDSVYASVVSIGFLAITLLLVLWSYLNE